MYDQHTADVERELERLRASLAERDRELGDMAQARDAARANWERARENFRHHEQRADRTERSLAERDRELEGLKRERDDYKAALLHEREIVTEALTDWEKTTAIMEGAISPMEMVLHRLGTTGAFYSLDAASKAIRRVDSVERSLAECKAALEEANATVKKLSAYVDEAAGPVSTLIPIAQLEEMGAKVAGAWTVERQLADCKKAMQLADDFLTTAQDGDIVRGEACKHHVREILRAALARLEKADG